MDQKKRQRLLCLVLALVVCVAFVIVDSNLRAATTVTNSQSGTEDGYNWELWKDSGTTSMTLNGGGAFSCSWSNIGNALFRKGKKYNSTQTHSQMGNISATYTASTYNPNGNSYLCIYGWTKDPLIEYYIVDSWGSWRPTSGTKKGSATIDGGTYDIYEDTRVNQPSISGNTTFKQFWSVRTAKRTSGTISVSEHFKAWEKVGLNLGKMYEVALTVEGYQSSGNATISSFSLNVGGSSSSSSSNTTTSNTTTNNNNTTSSGTAATATSGDTKYTFGQMSFSSNSGVSSYSVNSAGALTVNFPGQYKEVKYNLPSNLSLANCSSIIINAASASGNTAVKFYDTSGAEAFVQYNIKGSAGDVTVAMDSAKKGKTIKTIGVMSQDTSSYSATVNSIIFKGVASSSSSTTNNNTTTNNTTNNTTTTTTTSGTTKVLCNTMTMGGKYTGKISSPFAGIALYANDDLVKYTQNFASGTHSFSLRGASNNSKTATVDLLIGGQKKGTFSFSGTSPSTATISNVSHSTGNQEIQLKCVNDNDTWDAFIEYLEIK